MNAASDDGQDATLLCRNTALLEGRFRETSVPRKRASEDLKLREFPEPVGENRISYDGYAGDLPDIPYQSVRP